jgi:hypothetical protein
MPKTLTGSLQHQKEGRYLFISGQITASLSCRFHSKLSLFHVAILQYVIITGE